MLTAPHRMEYLNHIIVDTVVHDFQQFPGAVKTDDGVFVIKTCYKIIADMGLKNMPYILFPYSMLKRGWNKKI
jgi:hypothetical protein